jgi:hypothetical protein
LPDLERWTRLLDDLERSLATGGASDESTGWRPPSGLSPLPSELRGRAEALLAAQTEAIAALRTEQNSAARHLAALKTVPPGRDGSRPVYLDTNG